MPRSSGGGSHSGGSHHSSSHSSSRSSGGGSHSSGSHYSSSHSSSYSSGGGSHSSGNHYNSSHSSSYGNRTTYTPAPKIRKKEFSGSRRYVRYRNNKPEYIYSDSSLDRYDGGFLASGLSLTLSIVLGLSIVALVFVALAFVYAYFDKGKIDADYNKTIVIQDRAELFTDTAGLEEELIKFRDITGVTPAVITVNNESWETYYESLENYAFDLYVNTFEDEYHWLLVYSEPETVDPQFNDWYFEGIQGDNTTSVITSTLADNFTDDMQKYLTKESVSVEDAMINSFEHASEYADGQVNLKFSFVHLLVLIPFIIMVLIPYALKKLLKWFINNRYSGYVLDNEKKKASSPKRTAPEKIIPEKHEQRVCGYCNCVYFAGSITECPHCGAPVPIEK